MLKVSFALVRLKLIRMLKSSCSCEAKCHIYTSQGLLIDEIKLSFFSLDRSILKNYCIKNTSDLTVEPAAYWTEG